MNENAKSSTNNARRLRNDPFLDVAVKHGYESWYDFQYNEPQEAVRAYERITAVREINLFQGGGIDDNNYFLHFFAPVAGAVGQFSNFNTGTNCRAVVFGKGQ